MQQQSNTKLVQVYDRIEAIHHFNICYEIIPIELVNDKIITYIEY